MPYQLIDGKWNVSFNYFTFHYHIPPDFRFERSQDLQRVFNRHANTSEPEYLRMWSGVLFDYSHYMLSERLVSWYFNDKRYYQFLSESDKFEIAHDETFLRDFIKCECSTLPWYWPIKVKDDDFECFQKCYEIIKNIVNYINQNCVGKWYSLGNYVKPIKLPHAGTYIKFNDIQPRHIDLEAVRRQEWVKKNQELLKQQISLQHSSPVRRRGRPRKYPVHYPDLYGF